MIPEINSTKPFAAIRVCRKLNLLAQLQILCTLYTLTHSKAGRSKQRYWLRPADSSTQLIEICSVFHYLIFWIVHHRDLGPSSPSHLLADQRPSASAAIVANAWNMKSVSITAWRRVPPLTKATLASYSKLDVLGDDPIAIQSCRNGARGPIVNEGTSVRMPSTVAIPSASSASANTGCKLCTVARRAATMGTAIPVAVIRSPERVARPSQLLRISSSSRSTSAWSRSSCTVTWPLPQLGQFASIPAVAPSDSRSA